MAETYYECHITLEKPENPAALIMDIEDMHWSYSSIEDDIVTGPGVKCYATRHYNPRLGASMIREGLFAAAEMLQKRGHNVIRRKLEHVIFDDRSSKVDLI